MRRDELQKRRLSRRYGQRQQAGVSLVELIVFIVIVAVAAAGVLSALDLATRHSADPMIEKQALSIAESLMEEIDLMPFTYCDPDDPNAATATSAAGCSTPESIGPEGGETRYGFTTPFDNVNDYNGFQMLGGINDITNTAIPALAAYSASVSVQPAALDDIPNDGNALLITVTVTGPADTTVTLQGFRARYAPNALP